MSIAAPTDPAITIDEMEAEFSDQQPLVMRFEPKYLRKEPVQQRAINTLCDIAAATIKLLADPTIGRDRLTTAMVADEAGVSIGTVYAYVIDRVALLDYVWPERDSTYFVLIVGFDVTKEVKAALRANAIAETATDAAIEVADASDDTPKGSM